MDMHQAQALIQREMHAVDALIKQRMQSDVALINQLGHHIINSGGKRLRPQLAILAARASGYRGKDHISLAAVIEFIHTATLLHDDVVDSSELRRGQETANALFGNEAAVLVGDFLYSRAFEMMVEVGNIKIMQVFARTTNVIAEGEIMQLLNVHDPETTQTRYLDVIRDKTAKLFEAATRLGPILAGLPPAIESSMAAYGMHLGVAFQLIDDALDYSAEVQSMGKNIGDDLAEGKPTLPLIYVMQHGTAAQSALVKAAIEHGGLGQLDEILAAIQSTKALDYVYDIAQQEAERAISALAAIPDSDYKAALLAIAHFAIERTA